MRDQKGRVFSGKTASRELLFLHEAPDRRREEVALFVTVVEMAGLRLGAREERSIAPLIIPLAVKVVRFDSGQSAWPRLGSLLSSNN